jgi:hypothetical protein
MTLAPPPVTVLDWTTHQPDPPPRLFRDGAARFREDAHHKLFIRNPATVDGICLHQTACIFGPHNDIQKRHERAFDVPIHALAFNDGTVVLPYPTLGYLYHGGQWNSRSLGLEIEGQFPGLIADLPQRGETDVSHLGLSDIALAAACRGVEELVTRGRALGCPITHIWAHRQSAGDRRSDPGEEIWRRVALDFAVAKLGLIPQQSVHLRDGKSIPVEWDPHGVGHF